MVRPAIGRTAAGNRIGLPTEVDRVDYPRLIRIHEEDLLAFGEQRKPQDRVVVPAEAPRRNGRSIGNAELVCGGAVAQISAGKIHRHIAVIIKLQAIV